MMRNHLKIALFAAPGIIAPGLLAAACPVAQDLEAGIYVTDDEGSVTLFQTQGADIFERTDYADSTEGFTYRTAFGLLIINYASTEDGEPVADTQESYVYSKDPYALEVAEDSFWQARIVTKYTDGSDDLIENYTLAMGTAREITIGECNYTSIPVSHLSYFIEDGEFSAFMQDHIPELGISVATAYWDPVGGLDRYENVVISNIAPSE